MKAGHHREEDLFEAARQITDPADRTTFLDISCKDDPGMRTRLESLLTANEEAESFFEDGATLFNQAETVGLLQEQVRKATKAKDPHKFLVTETVGQRIGRYKLTQKIGEGGCGVVYLAEQEEPVRRHVALKIIRSGMETKSVIARFEAERQALAMMDHPNIARVFDAGETEDGLPYFVMEHVRGVRITEYCDEHRLSLEDRLNLFIQICHAIQHAHQNCIVHGDIKPSNIMIAQHDGVPLPKVIDFGISKATESRRPESHPHVSVAQLVGTPAYMSPEQVEFGGLEIDTRSDIYSLGVLLYELLTGKTPIEGKLLATGNLEGIRRIFRDHRPVHASDRLQALAPDSLDRVASARRIPSRKLVQILHGDLDCILSKALQPDRRRRYESADALAMDVVRYLHLEPVTAHPPSWIYRTSKLFRRNRGVFLASAAVAAALVLGTGISTWLFLKERDARQRAVAAEQQQARLRTEAETRERIAQAAFLVSQERYEEADDIIRTISLDDSTLEGAAVFRSIGEWHATNGRWKMAAERFEVLLRINHLEGADVSSLDYLELGPALIELGDMVGFDRFRREAIRRFSGKQNPFSDRIVKISLLRPADQRLLNAIFPLAEMNAAAARDAELRGDAFTMAWRSMSMALYEYRCGGYAAAARWCRKSLAAPDNNGPRTAAVRTILAMTLYHMNLQEEAGRELEEAWALTRPYMEGPLERGSPVNGFWFDWAFARILMREAETVLSGQELALAGPDA